jgi:hypothetical protein
MKLWLILFCALLPCFIIGSGIYERTKLAPVCDKYADFHFNWFTKALNGGLTPRELCYRKKGVGY